MTRDDIQIITDFVSRNKDNYLEYKKHHIDNMKCKNIYEQTLYIENFVMSPTAIGLLAYISKLGIPVAYKSIKSATHKVWFWNIKRKYDNLVKDYNKIKNQETVPKHIEQSLQSRILSIKSELDRFNNRNSDVTNSFDLPDDSYANTSNYNTDTTEINNMKMDNSSDVSYTEPSSMKSNTFGGSVGDVTTRIDAEALSKFQDIWKGRCSGLVGPELQKCKIIAATNAITYIDSSMSKCNSTSDPDGCKETLRNLMAYWNERKSKYMDRQFKTTQRRSSRR